MELRGEYEALQQQIGLRLREDNARLNETRALVETLENQVIGLDAQYKLMGSLILALDKQADAAGPSVIAHPEDFVSG